MYVLHHTIIGCIEINVLLRNVQTICTHSTAQLLICDDKAAARVQGNCDATHNIQEVILRKHYYFMEANICEWKMCGNKQWDIKYY